MNVRHVHINTCFIFIFYLNLPSVPCLQTSITPLGATNEAKEIVGLARATLRWDASKTEKRWSRTRTDSAGSGGWGENWRQRRVTRKGLNHHPKPILIMPSHPTFVYRATDAKVTARPPHHHQCNGLVGTAVENTGFIIVHTGKTWVVRWKY